MERKYLVSQCDLQYSVGNKLRRNWKQMEHVSFLSAHWDRTQTPQKSTGNLLDAREGVGLEMNTELNTGQVTQDKMTVGP
jgi:hypothetical protein